MQTQVEELAENRVRLTVDVPREHVKHAVEHAASDLAGSVRIPGFRKGKVPLPVLVSRVGRERLFQEAVESHIGGWFRAAAAREKLRPIAQPQYDFELPASDTEDWRFTATVDVQPPAELADWTTLDVARPDLEVPAELVEQELDALRSSVAEIVPVDGRGAEEGDTLVLDLVSGGGDVQRDYVVELGAGQLVEELEQALVGMTPGETKEIGFARGDDGETAVTVTLKELKEKVLPPVDDDLARAASEFDTIEELRADIEARLREQLEDEIETGFRSAAVDALVDASRVEPAPALVDARARDLLAALARSVERRGISLDTYLRMTGGSAEQLVERLRDEARRAIARELVLEAVAERLGLEVSDDEVEQLVREQAAAASDDADEALARLRESGGFERLRDDLRLRAALDRVAAEVKPIAADLARAREAIWTPEKEKTPADTKLWTPGSKEPA